MTGEITLFVDPTAGRGRGAHAAQPAASALRAAGFQVRTVLGADARDAPRRARRAVEDGTGALVAVGGDAMVNLALQTAAGTTTPLGVIAAGTGNDFARALGLPLRDPARAGHVAARALNSARPRDIDLGRVGGRWFATVLACGFDSKVNDRGNRMRLPGGRFKVVGACSRATLIKVFPRVHRGTHLSHPDVTTHRVASITLAAPGISGYADGERLGPLPVAAECVRAAVRVLAPLPAPRRQAAAPGLQ
ncbi:diacylglycerol kinase family protein [Streptomyces sp. NPDC006711]|uniref:diacylglycerol kinase family protein n=1 Tax=Streptomyces sp. NPDC006711 TaxID=3364762 RepID=UPI00367B3F6B